MRRNDKYFDPFDLMALAIGQSLVLTVPYAQWGDDTECLVRQKVCRLRKRHGINVVVNVDPVLCQSQRTLTITRKA